MLTLVENPQQEIKERIFNAAYVVQAARLTALLPLRAPCAVGLLSLAALVGCSTPLDGNTSLLDRTLHVIGLERTRAASASRSTGNAQLTSKQNKRIALRIHAAPLLNTGVTGESLAVVIKLYKLRNKDVFERSPYAAFQKTDFDGYSELRAEIVESRETVLAPKGKYEVIEDIDSSVSYFAVVVLFRSPAKRRWRFIFDSAAAATTGITLGLHGCAVSVATGQPLDVPAEFVRLGSVRCDALPSQSSSGI